MVLARVVAAEDFNMPAIRKLEDPEIGFGVDQCEAEHVLVKGGCSTPSRLTRGRTHSRITLGLTSVPLLRRRM
jgi:hypothetical protein